MNPIEIRQMVTEAERRKFVLFPWQIYRKDALWVPPLVSERLKVTDPQRGGFFRRGYAEFFMAFREGKPVGTISCAEDPPSNAARKVRDCMIGFFECVEDERVAFALFDHARAWAARRQLETLYGPFNLDYEDSYGVLVEGRDRPPVLLCGHSPIYYRSFFENYGFRPARGRNLAYAITEDAAGPTLQRLERLAARIQSRGRILVRSVNLADWDAEVDRVHYLLVKALAHLPDYAPWPRDDLEADLKAFRDLVDPELILFAEADGKTVGWFPGIPNLNEVLIHANGLRYPWDYLRLFWHMRQPRRCLAIKSVVVLPEYWDTGVAVLLFHEMARRARPKGYKWYDLSLTSDDNPYTPALAQAAGAKLYKQYQVYRLYLGEQREVTPERDSL
jgi:GNAT superfamily N-acetyltransferase